MKSKALQKEILEERAVAVGQTDREFYKKNRSTQGSHLARETWSLFPVP